MKRQLLPGLILDSVVVLSPDTCRPFSRDRAGLGTCITLLYADGHRETYNVLGEWDRDEALNIISCNSQLALAVEGKRAGETVRVPAQGGGTECQLEAVGDLPAPVQAWIAAEPPPPADLGVEEKE